MDLSINLYPSDLLDRFVSTPFGEVDIKMFNINQEIIENASLIIYFYGRSEKKILKNRHDVRKI